MHIYCGYCRLRFIEVVVCICTFRSTLRSLIRTAVLYSLGYLYEHWEEADHHDLVMTLRNLLSSIREGVF